MTRAYRERQMGRIFPVLFEEEREGLWRGHTPNYLEAAMESAEDLHNRVRSVRVTGLTEDGLLVEPAQ